MGGECYRYVRFLRNATPTKDGLLAYERLLPRLRQELEIWYDKECEDGREKEWICDLRPSNENLSLTLKVSPTHVKSDKLPGVIVLPKKLSTELDIGWQHRNYGSVEDPKYAIATKLMNMLLKNEDIRNFIREEQEDNIAVDLDLVNLNRYINESLQRGPCDYGQLNFSNGGFYQGYDDYDDYLDSIGHYPNSP
eukprot:Awhi_evm1s356